MNSFFFYSVPDFPDSTISIKYNFHCYLKSSLYGIIRTISRPVITFTSTCVEDKNALNQEKNVKETHFFAVVTCYFFDKPDS